MLVNSMHMLPNTMITRTYNGSPKQVVGTIEIELLIGPQIFLVTLQVMYIHPSYMLLGRLWIQATDTVTSSLHQCLKYIVNETLVIVKTEETLIMVQNMIVSYIEAEGSKDKNPHAFEIVNTYWVLENMVLRKLIISQATKMATKYFLRHKLPF